eukprot:UN19685
MVNAVPCRKSYAKSVFGEDALVNISIEKQVDGKLP